MKYKITGVRQRTREKEGEREQFFRVFYETEKAQKGSVDIVKENFSEKEARKVIEKEIKELVKLEKEKEVRV